MRVDRVYKALGDPIRLEMIRRLSKKSPQSIVELSFGLEMTRQGARKQLSVLADSNTVKLVPKGRETEVHINPKEINKAKQFLESLEQIWDKRLAALKDLLESEDQKRKGRNDEQSKK